VLPHLLGFLSPGSLPEPGNLCWNANSPGESCSRVTFPKHSREGWRQGTGQVNSDGGTHQTPVGAQGALGSAAECCTVGPEIHLVIAGSTQAQQTAVPLLRSCLSDSRDW